MHKALSFPKAQCFYMYMGMDMCTVCCLFLCFNRNICEDFCMLCKISVCFTFLSLLKVFKSCLEQINQLSFV